MRSITRFHIALTVALAGALTAAGCAQQPNAMLQEAQAAYSAARTDPQIVGNAPLELNRANETLQRAQRLERTDAETEEVTHQAYLAKQQVAIAREASQLKVAQQQIEQADTRRAAVLLETRNRELQAARQRADVSQKELETAQLRSQEMQTQAQQQEMERLRQEAARAQQLETQMKEQQAQKAQELEAQIAQMKELETKETPRGLVVSLPDVLFDVGKSDLKTGAERTIEKLASVLKENPERTISIEGFTDSTGSDQLNRRLSEQRADAVRRALVDHGVNPERIQTRGYGENYPIASNETPAGRQLNRRVEIIISHGDETVSKR